MALVNLGNTTMGTLDASPTGLNNVFFVGTDNTPGNGFLCTTGGEVEAIVVGYNLDTNLECRVGIYEDAGSASYPLLSGSEQYKAADSIETISGTQHWHTFNYTGTKPIVVEGQKYRIASGCASTSLKPKYTTGTGEGFSRIDLAGSVAVTALEDPAVSLQNFSNATMSMYMIISSGGDPMAVNPKVFKMAEDASSGATDGIAIDVSVADQAFDPPIRAIYVGTSGDIKLDTGEGTTLTFTSVPAGVFPVAATKIYNTGTTAAAMVGLY